MLTFKQRYTIARQEFDFGCWHCRQAGGLAYDVHCLSDELEFDRMQGIRTIAPNRLGLWLLVLASEAWWRWKLVAFALFGRYMAELDL